MRIWRGKQATKAAHEVLGEEFAAECEAFLQGRFAALLSSRHETVPPWARLNQVAHGDLEQLRALAGSVRPAPQLGQPAWEWLQAVADIAAELLWLVGDDPPALRQLQLEALVPLEADMMGQRPRRAFSPSGLLGDAQGALLRAFPTVSRGDPPTTERDPRRYDGGNGPGSAP